ncbi:hypothetical protein ACJRO7_034370 [Eucalyptus globulus]|uniref:Malectin-like domain-containing protein n=1 Tax=Eucalyptus globulus TaxID=34317 RepID=A0ABD3JC60_EUCGL
MAKLHIIHGVHTPGFILFFVSLQFPLLLTLSSTCTTQTSYFINCGSSKSLNYSHRVFVGDTSSDSISFTKQSTSTQSSNQFSTVSEIYDTARIFGSPSSQYVLDVNDKGTHIVRLHFLPFASTRNLSEAVFNVSVRGLTLLSDFQIPGGTNSPVVEEFLLSINSNKFILYFSPQGSSFAFINALEVFLVPDGVIPGSAPSVGISGKNSGNYSGIPSQVSRTVYRINVGGDEVTPVDDPLWRNTAGYGRNLNYQDGSLDRCLPSERVYLTAKEMTASAWPLHPNTTWGFKVSANVPRLVRTHFCDFISPSLNTVHFNLYIYENFAEVIDPYNKEGFREDAVPFHYDYVIQPGSSGLVNMSIGLLSASETTSQQAYLNGLEIMEIIGSWDSVLAGEINPNSLKKYGEVAEKCLQEEDEERPSMGDVLWDLEYALQLQQTAVKRGMYDDSTTDGSSILTLSNVRKLPSFSTDLEEEGVSKEWADSSETSTTGVFSQMKIDEAR